MKFINNRTFLALSALSICSLMPCIAAEHKEKPDQVLKESKGKQWITTWGTSPAESGRSAAEQTLGLAPQTFNNQTIRMIVHTSIGGDSIRIRFTNAYPSGLQPSPLPQCLCAPTNRYVNIQEAHVALQSSGAAISALTDRMLTFNGELSVILPPNGEVLSDPISLRVPAQSDLAISMYVTPVTGATANQIYAARHPVALQTSYIASAPGNFTNDVDGTSFDQTTNQWFFISDVEVQTNKSTSTIVAFGDSLTDGFSVDGSTLNTNTRYPDFLARRLIADHSSMGVVNAGISGNQLYYDSPWVGLTNSIFAPFGQNGIARFSKDALDKPGVSHIIVCEGINDLIYSYNTIPSLPKNVYQTTVDQIINGYKQMIQMAHERDIEIFGATLPPTGASPLSNATIESMRQEVNDWIREECAFDAVIDFDAALADPSNPSRINPAYNSGDGLHPNAAGYQAMAAAIDLKLFKGKNKVALKNQIKETHVKHKDKK
jgi:lysophospholipase L1-like esterase